jgi:hypothetical protein
VTEKEEDRLKEKEKNQKKRDIQPNRHSEKEVDSKIKKRE